jgi:hypothetical protein
MASVAKRSRPRVVHAFTGRYGVLLVALIAFLLLAPLLVVSWFWGMALAMLAGAVMVAGLVTARPGRRSLAIGLGLAATDIVIGRLAPVDSVRWMAALRAILWIGTMAYVAAAILEAIFEDERVTLETLQASFCVYLLLALIWAYIPVLIELAAPGSYRSPSGAVDRWSSDGWSRAAFLRFLTLSLSNLTGAGDPDIRPESGFAKICASLEGMMGQVYLATVIARLVGMYTAREAESRSDG